MNQIGGINCEIIFPLFYFSFFFYFNCLAIFQMQPSKNLKMLLTLGAVAICLNTMAHLECSVRMKFQKAIIGDAYKGA